MALTKEEICEILDKQCAGEFPPHLLGAAILTLLKDIEAIGGSEIDLSEVILNLEALCDKLLTITDNTDGLEACLVELKAAMEALCDKLEAVGDNTDLIEECFATIKTLLEALCDKLEALGESNAEVVACLETVKELLTKVCEKIDALTELIDSLIEECCLAQGESEVDRWCQNFGSLTSGGNSDENTTITLSIGGVSEPLPNPYTSADLIAAATSIAPGGGWIVDEDGRLCRTDGPGAVGIRTVTCQDRVCGLSAVVPVQVLVPAAEPVCRNYLRTWGKFEEPIANILQGMLDKLCEMAGLGADCDSPTWVKQCPPDPCPPPAIEIYCDGEGGTKYVTATHVNDLCGVSGSFVADDYYAEPQVLTPYTPTAGPVVCADATIKDNKCYIDECGTRWSCVDILNPVAGTVVESQTCVPYTAPEECAEPEGEGREEAPVRAEMKLARKAVSASFSAVASIKLTVAAVNTAITTITNTETFELSKPVGELCPCPCPTGAETGDIVECCEDPCFDLRFVFNNEENPIEVRDLKGETIFSGTPDSFANFLQGEGFTEGIQANTYSKDCVPQSELFYVWEATVPNNNPTPLPSDYVVSETFVDFLSVSNIRGFVDGVTPGECGNSLSTKDCNSDKILDKLCAIAANTADSCADCKPLVETDTVCNAEDQTVGDVTIAAGQPIIRKTITTYEVSGCDCKLQGIEVRFFNFDNPSQELVGEVVFDSICDFEANTVTRCDRNGNEIQVVSITVNTDDGGTTQVSYTDANGDPVPEPLLPLSICNPQVTDQKGCVVAEDGTKTYGTLHLQYDNVGNPGYDVSFFTSDIGVTTQLGTRRFICGCEPSKECLLPLDKYCYDVSGFSFPCDSSTIIVNGEEVDLCGGSSNVIPNSGDLCTVGGVRSSILNDRCRGDYAEPTTDPAGLAAELQSFGSFGDENVNPTVNGLTTANFYMAVRGTFPSLEGTTQATISLDTTWEVGSGVSIHAYDCKTGQDLPLVSGTPTTFAADAACSDGTRGPNDAWGAGNNGLSQTTVFDTSGVADLGDVVFWSIVLNPPGDAILDVKVEGLEPGGSCNVTDINTLSQILSQVTNTPWTVEGESLVCTVTQDTLGPLTCGETSVDPEVTDASFNETIPYVAIDPCTVKELAAAIADASGGSERTVGFECVSGVPVGIVEILENGVVTGYRTQALEIEGLCHCCEEKCAPSEGARSCTRLDGFDNDKQFVEAGESKPFVISVDNVVQATVVHDYTTTSDGTNTSSFYDPVIAAINAVPGWSISLVSDVPIAQSGKPTWEVVYTGTGPSTLEINMDGGQSVMTMTADGNGGMTTSANWSDDGGTSPFSECE